MAEHFSFFDAVLQDDGVTYDREYNAQQFTKYFGALVTTGVMKGMSNMLAVSANGSNMVTKIDTGIAFVEAKYYENDSFKELTHDTETLGNSRIDRIVIRMDLSTEARYVKVFIKKGLPSTNPVAPTLTQTANLYEISLAQVKIVGGQTFIATNAVTDERGQKVICPWAGSNILPSFDDNALNEHIKDNVRHTTLLTATYDDSGSYLVFNATLNGVEELYDGLLITIKVPYVSDKSVRLNLNGLGAKSILANAGGFIRGKTLEVNTFMSLRYSSNYNFWIFEGFNQTPEDSGAVNLSFNSGWTYGGNTPRVRKYGPFVFVEFSTRPTATSSPKVMGQLPVNFRPDNPIGFLIYGRKSGTFQVFNGFLDVAGNLTIGADTAVSNLTLTDTISFSFAFYKP